MDGEGDEDAEEEAGADFEPGMAEEFDEVFVRDAAVLVEFVRHLVEKAGLDAGGAPDALGIDHDEAKKAEDDREGRGAEAVAEADGRGGGGAGGGVGAGHAAEAEEEREVEFPFTAHEGEKFEDLGGNPSRDAAPDGNVVPKGGVHGRHDGTSGKKRQQKHCTGGREGVGWREMRKIGQLENGGRARTFADYLLVQGIAAETEPAGDGEDAPWNVWVLDEDRVEAAKALLSRFRSMPDAEEFETAAAEAAKRRAAEARAAEKAAVPGRASARRMPEGVATSVLMGLCVLAAVLTRLGDDEAWVQWLTISAGGGAPADALHFWRSLTQVGEGQVWRLVTPIFLHFSLWHLVLNLLWFRDLGRVLEQKLGGWKLAVLVLALAVVSNLAQFAVAGGNFGGLSGVVYGLFGYLWVRGRMEPGFGTWIHPVTSTMMLLFLALGVFGLIGPIANTTHFSGLLAGAAFGWAAARRRNA